MPDDKELPGICRAFNSPRAVCTKDNCQELHVCFLFATGRCRYGNKCTRTHLLTTVHNKSVLKANGWHHDNQHPTILKALQEKFKPMSGVATKENKTKGLDVPKVCFIYNTLGCGNQDCKHLHLCLNSIMGRCANGSKCHLEHDLVNSEHNIRILRGAKLLDIETDAIKHSLRNTYISMGGQASKEHQTNHSKDPKQNKADDISDNAKENKKSLKAPSACIHYNKAGCKKDSCPFLHVCFSLIMGTCDKKGACHLEHNVFQGQQNVQVLRKFNLITAHDVLGKIREGYEIRARDKAAALAECGGATGGADMPPPMAAAAAGKRSRSAAPVSLVCSVCCEPFIKATTLGCSHTFCDDCVRQATRRANACPLCRAAVASSVRSLVVDDAVEEWLDGQDEQTQRARRQLVSERRQAAAATSAVAAVPAVQPAGQSGQRPADRQQRSRSRSRGGKTVVTTMTTYH